MLFHERSGLVCALAGCVALVAGCGSAGSGQADVADSELGTASFSLNSLPSGAQCLQITGSGASNFSINVTLTAANFSIGRLPLGAYTVNANAYDVACASIGTNQPSWIADPLSVTFRTGVITTLALNLHQNNAINASLDFLPNIVAISTGYSGTALVTSDGNTRVGGQLSGVGTANTFVPLPALAGAIDVAADRFNHACARTSSNLLCWGYNGYGELGPNVGIGVFTSTPTVVPGVGAGASQVSVGGYHTCAIDKSASPGLYCWGQNTYGQVGNGTTTNVTTPTWVSIAVGPSLLALGDYHSCANTYVGVECWGQNVYGQLGDGTTTNRTTPVIASGTNGTISLSAGSGHTCAVRADGTVRCWGYNGFGQLGDGTTTSRLTAVQVSGITDAVQVGVGSYFTCVRRQNGTLSCWGDGSDGQLGDGTGVGRLLPTAVPGVSGVVQMSVGQDTVCVLQDNQQVLCWGLNWEGQIGDNTVINRFKPTPAMVQ